MLAPKHQLCQQFTYMGTSLSYIARGSKQQKELQKGNGDVEVRTSA